MKFATTSIITIAALASLAACAAPVDSSEGTGQNQQASSTSGVFAAITSTWSQSGNYLVYVQVTNNSSVAQTSWDVEMSAPTNLTVTNPNLAEAANIGGIWSFRPDKNHGGLAAGASLTFYFGGQYSGTFAAPSIVSVDGMANGTGGASPDGVDHIARTAASGALGVAFQYEANKLPNQGDSAYSLYDGLIWDSHSYFVQGPANGVTWPTIAFDPNVPGYKYIPQQAMAALATIQQDPSVSAFLVNGLESCLQDVNGASVYYFQTATLKGFPNTTSGTVPGVPVNGSNSAVNTFTVSSAPAGQGASVITVTEKSTTPNPDNYFGLLIQVNGYVYPNMWAVNGKYSGGGQSMCSPFNGAGGQATNPYFVLTLNGQQIAARAQTSVTQCQTGCTSTIVLDPIAYTIPGPQYDANNNLLGPQNNPFTLDPTDTYADPTHYMQFSTNPASQSGTFSKTVTLLGQPVDRWLLCGMYGSGC